VKDVTATRPKAISKGVRDLTPCYRAFLLDNADRVFAVRFLITKKHTDALRLAERIQAPCDMIEVWCGTTRLGLVAPKNKMG
jgi:hypothetical protein